MSARIRSLKNMINPVEEASRDDLAAGDIVTLQAMDAATTYAWALVFVPEGSTATFSGDPLSVSPGSFTVDLPGSYLARLTVDATLPTESSQYVRLRAITTSLGLKLVAAGERRDSTGIIPVDADPEGWANDQNANLLALEAAISGTSPYITLVSGEALAAHDVVTFDTNLAGGRVIKSNASVAARHGVIGVVVGGVGGAGVPVVIAPRPGSLLVMTFNAAPVAANQGSPVYLHTVNGQVSMTAPVAPTTEVMRVGILQQASTSTVMYLPQFVGLNP